MVRISSRLTGFWSLIFMACAVLTGSARAAAPTQAPAYPSLEEPSPPAVKLATVPLIAITRAGNRLVAGGAHGVIIYSDDNGAHWTQAHVPVSVTITDIAFATPQDGWAVGAYGVVLHTTDGGKSWVRQITGIEVNKLMLANAQKVAAAAPGQPSSQLAVRRANIFMAAGPDKPFLSIDAQSPQKVTVFGAYRMCVSSDDAGKNWQDCSLAVPDPISHNLYGATVDGGTVYIAAEVGHMFTMNQADGSFTALTSPGTTTLFGTVLAKDGALVAYGVAGAAYLSTDGGQTWTTLNMPTQSDITGGLRLTSGAIVLITEAGGLLVSTDNGQSFAPLGQNMGEALCAAVQAANGDLVLAGLSGIRVVPKTALK